MEPKLSEEQIQDREDQLARGRAFLEMQSNQGWQLVMQYVESQIQNFSTQAITEGYEEMKDFNLARGKVEGLREMLALIDYEIEQFQTQNEQSTDDTTTE